MTTIRKGLIKRIHVDQHVIRANKRDGTSNPPITVQTSKGPIKASRVVVEGPSMFVYKPDEPLSCGARLWIETTAQVVAFS